MSIRLQPILEKWWMTPFLVAIGIFICRVSVSSADAATSDNPEYDILGVEMPQEIAKIHGQINMKYPFSVRYTGRGGDEIELDTWMVTDKLTGARTLVVCKAGSSELACVSLPPIK